MTERAGDLKNDQTEFAPAIDYLSKDFASFRRLMLDRLASVASDAATGNAADLGTVLVELLAYAADQTSYYQDAVANECYLSTARLRTSVRRHARLLDYPMHDGCNARVWVSIIVTASADGLVLPAHTCLFTRIEGQSAILTDQDVVVMRSLAAQPFETMHDLLLQFAHNEIALQGDSDVFATGATSVMLRNDDKKLALRIGDVLIFEERDVSLAVGSGDPQRRHAVRLTNVETSLDTTGTQSRVIVSWDTRDALPFDLTLSRTYAIGNVALADHGYTLLDAEPLFVGALPASEEEQAATVSVTRRPDRPRLKEGPLTWQAMVLASGQPQPIDLSAPASLAFPTVLDPNAIVQPAIDLRDPQDHGWTARRDLLGSAPHAYDFVVETEDDGSTYLRFGDDSYGKHPYGQFQASYRVGNGLIGNIGADALYHIQSKLPGLLRARNPLAGKGGVDPESIDQVRLNAPHFFRRQERAVTSDDYATLATRFPEVRHADVVRRWSGSAFTYTICVQRAGGQLVDDDFASRLRAFLDGYRMAGHALHIVGPVKIPLDIMLSIGVASGHWRSAVVEAVKAVLGPDIVNGKPGFFHPDQFTPGQPVYLSQVVSTAMKVKGVSFVDVVRFYRYGDPKAISTSIIPLRKHEVPVIENIADKPERGRLEIVIGGGS